MSYFISIKQLLKLVHVMTEANKTAKTVTVELLLNYRSIFSAVSLDVVSMWDSPVLHGDMFGPIFKHWLLDNVSYSAAIQR